MHRRTVFRWLADFYNGGEPALKAKADSWSPSDARRASDSVAGSGGDRPEAAAARLQGRAVDVVDPARDDPAPVWPHHVPGLGQSRHVAARHHGAGAPLQGLAAGPRTGAEVGDRGITRHQAASARTEGDGVLCRRGGHPFGLSHRHDLGTGGTDTCGDGNRPALLAQHAFGRQSQG